MEIRWALKNLYSQSYKLEDHMVQLPWLGLLAFFFLSSSFLSSMGGGIFYMYHLIFVSSIYIHVHIQTIIDD